MQITNDDKQLQAGWRCRKPRCQSGVVFAGIRTMGGYVHQRQYLRIKALLRRGPVREMEIFTFGGLRIDVLRRRVTRAEKRTELTPKEYALLHLLAVRHGE